MRIELDQFNSDIFGIAMGNITLSDNEMNKENFRVEEIVAESKRKGFEHISMKLSTSYKTLFNKFIQSGFYLTDTLFEYIYKFGGGSLPNVIHKTILRDYKEDDIKRLMVISKGAFDYDRYHSDPTLNNELCDKYYEQWIYNSCRGFADKVIVSGYDNDVVGFTTGKANHNQKYGHLVLSAVSREYRGLGIYTSMIYEGVKWLEKEGFEGVIVGTQINNIAVQKAWIKLGFTVFNSEYVLHLHI